MTSTTSTKPSKNMRNRRLRAFWRTSAVARWVVEAPSRAASLGRALVVLRAL
jgi:hypothetical protein